MEGRIRIFYQGPNRLCAVLHGSLRERSELQLRSDVARSVLHQLYPDREGKVRHPLENFLHHQPGPLRYCGPGHDPGLSRDRHSGSARFVLPGGICRHPGLSMDGINGIPVPLGLAQAFQSFMCGNIFGVEGQTTEAALVCK